MTSKQAAKLAVEQATFPLEQKIESLSRRNAELASKNKQALERIESLASELDLVNAIDLSCAKPAVIKPHLGNGKSESTAILLCSDWHVFETVDPETVNNRNSFSPAICQERVEKLAQKAVLLTEIHRHATKVDTLVVALLGDFINGMIHEDAQESNAGSPAEEVIFAFEQIAALLDFLSSNGGFSRIVIPCSVGNHGRDTHKMRASTGATRSYEWILYKFLASHYKANKKIQFVITKSYHNVVEVFGRKVRLHHGDAMNYGGGVGGLTIPANKAIAQWNKEEPVWLDCFGHFHTAFFGGNFLANGSLVGYNAYAKRIKASFEPPVQQFALVEKTHGLTGIHPIYL